VELRIGDLALAVRPEGSVRGAGELGDEVFPGECGRWVGRRILDRLVHRLEHEPRHLGAEVLLDEP